MGLRNAPVHGSVSPALFHGENQLSRNKSSAGHSRTFEAESGLPPRRQEEKCSYSSSLAQSFHSSRQNPHASEQQVRPTHKSNFPVTPVQETSEQQACCEQRRRLPYSPDRTDIGGAELSHHSGAEQQALCEQRRRSPYFANRPVIGGAELSHHSGTEQQALCENLRRLPYFANRPVIGGAELSHHSGTEKQALCEQRRRLPYFANRPVIGGAELSHHSSTAQPRLCVSRDEAYPTSRTDQLSVVRNSHTTAAQNSQGFV